MNSFAFGKHSRKFPNCLSPLYVWKVSFKSTWTLVAYFQMVATVHPCLPRVAHFARSEHGNVSWWKLVQGFVRTWQRWDFCYFDSQPKILSFFRLRIFPCWVGRGEIPDLNQTCLGGFDLWQDFRLVLKLFQSRKEDWRWSLKYLYWYIFEIFLVHIFGLLAKNIPSQRKLWDRFLFGSKLSMTQCTAVYSQTYFCPVFL